VLGEQAHGASEVAGQGGEGEVNAHVVDIFGVLGGAATGLHVRRDRQFLLAALEQFREQEVDHPERDVRGRRSAVDHGQTDLQGAIDVAALVMIERIEVHLPVRRFAKVVAGRLEPKRAIRGRSIGRSHNELVQHAINVGNPHRRAVLAKACADFLVQRLDLRTRDLGKGADIRERELAAPKQAAFTEATTELIAFRQGPGKRHQQAFGIAPREASAHQLMPRLELPIDVADEIGAANGLFAESDLDRAVGEALRFAEKLVNVGDADHGFGVLPWGWKGGCVEHGD
jgi:hypothetical protein